MAFTLKALCAFALVAVVAGCAQRAPVQDEVIYVEPAPIVAEPVLNKYR